MSQPPPPSIPPPPCPGSTPPPGSPLPAEIRPASTITAPPEISSTPKDGATTRMAELSLAARQEMRELLGRGDDAGGRDLNGAAEVGARACVDANPLDGGVAEQALEGIENEENGAEEGGSDEVVGKEGPAGEKGDSESEDNQADHHADTDRTAVKTETVNIDERLCGPSMSGPKSALSSSNIIQPIGPEPSSCVPSLNEDPTRSRQDKSFKVDMFRNTFSNPLTSPEAQGMAPSTHHGTSQPIPITTFTHTHSPNPPVRKPPSQTSRASSQPSGQNPIDQKRMQPGPSSSVRQETLSVPANNHHLRPHGTGFAHLSQRSAAPSSGQSSSRKEVTGGSSHETRKDGVQAGQAIVPPPYTRDGIAARSMQNGNSNGRQVMVPSPTITGTVKGDGSSGSGVARSGSFIQSTTQGTPSTTISKHIGRSVTPGTRIGDRPQSQSQRSTPGAPSTTVVPPASGFQHSPILPVPIQGQTQQRTLDQVQNQARPIPLGGTIQATQRPDIVLQDGAEQIARRQMRIVCAPPMRAIPSMQELLLPRQVKMHEMWDREVKDMQDVVLSIQDLQGHVGLRDAMIAERDAVIAEQDQSHHEDSKALREMKELGEITKRELEALREVTKRELDTQRALLQTRQTQITAAMQLLEKSQEERERMDKSAKDAVAAREKVEGEMVAVVIAHTSQGQELKKSLRELGESALQIQQHQRALDNCVNLMKEANASMEKLKAEKASMATLNASQDDQLKQAILDKDASAKLMQAAEQKAKESAISLEEAEKKASMRVKKASAQLSEKATECEQLQKSMEDTKAMRDKLQSDLAETEATLESRTLELSNIKTQTRAFLEEQCANAAVIKAAREADYLKISSLEDTLKQKEEDIASEREAWREAQVKHEEEVRQITAKEADLRAEHKAEIEKNRKRLDAASVVEGIVAAERMLHATDLEQAMERAMQAEADNARIKQSLADMSQPAFVTSPLASDISVSARTLATALRATAIPNARTSKPAVIGRPIAPYRARVAIRASPPASGSDDATSAGGRAEQAPNTKDVISPDGDVASTVSHRLKRKSPDTAVENLPARIKPPTLERFVQRAFTTFTLPVEPIGGLSVRSACAFCWNLRSTVVQISGDEGVRHMLARHPKRMEAARACALQGES